MPTVPAPLTGWQGLSTNQQNEMHDIFALLDCNMDGMIGVPEVVFALQGATGEPEIDEAEVRSWLQMISTDPNGEIDIYDLTQIIASYEGRQDNTAKAKTRQIDDVFRMIDDTNSGSLTAQQLQKLAGRVGLKWTPVESQEILTACDVDRNGRVDKADFVKVMKAAWEQPQERWKDVKLAERAKIAARQAEIDRMQAKLDETAEGAEPDPALLEELTALKKEADIERLTKALKHMPDGEERTQSEAELDLLLNPPEPEPEPEEPAE